MRAQVSLDLLLAIAVAAVSLGAVTLAGNEITELQKQSSVREQLDSIGTEVARALTVSAALDDASDSSVSFEVSRLLVLGERNPQPCRITIQRPSERITLEYTIIYLDDPTKNKTITVTKRFIDPENMLVQGTDAPNVVLACGETLTVSTP